MKICLIGGIYAKGGGRSEYVKVTPETTLENGFRDAGHDVTTLSHYDETDFSRFDVVHVHHLSYGAARLASDRSATPYVFTAHDASHMCGASLGLARRLALSYVLSRADAVVSLSRAEAEFQSRAYRLRSVRQRTIPNGIESGQFPYCRLNAAGHGQPWRLLFVGLLIPLKGCDLLLRAIALLKHDVELTLAYQTDALEGDLRSLASQLGITSRVKFIGKQNPRQLAGLYQHSDLLLLPSETEALPSVITEAMLSGLPFVASAVGGITEQSAGFGHLIARRTVEHLAGDIAQVLDRYPHYAAQGQAMSDHARRTFSIPTMVGAHLDLYRDLAGQPVRRAAAYSLPVNLLVRTAVHQWGRAGKPEMIQAPITATERL
jgi:glycosyltransferase involved in cell wall biosynthesis